MKNTISVLMLVLMMGLITLFGCSTADDPVLNIDASVQNFMNADDASGLQEGDQIGLFIRSTDVSDNQSATSGFVNIPYQLQGGNWISAAQMQWPEGEDGSSFSFMAYAPYQVGMTLNNPFDFSCKTDQSSLANLHASDFILAQTRGSKGDAPVKLIFKHLFSLIKINLKAKGESFPSIKELNLEALITSSVILSGGTTSTKGNTARIRMMKQETPTSGYAETFCCIVPPQSFKGDCINVVLADGKELKISIDQFVEANMCYQFNATLLDNERVVLDGVTVNQWSKSDILIEGAVETSRSYRTGDVITYQRTRTVNPVTLVVIPEGFTQNQLRQNGEFEVKARQAMEFLFGVEPYKSYQDYFNVYFIAAVSNEQGADSLASSGYKAHYHDTYFDAGWTWDDNYGEMKANADSVFDFVNRFCPDIKSGKVTVDDVSILMLINDKRYAGITHCYSTGKSYAMVPLIDEKLSWSGKTPELTGYSNGDWRNIVLHEFGGHSFGRLQDEYWMGNSKYPSKTISIHSWQVPLGLNVTADISETSTTFYWKQMVGDERFPKVGTYEGGIGYAYGVWRSELISCMIDNRRYFSAWQRYLIVKRIHELANEDLSDEKFLMKDVNYDEILDQDVGKVYSRHDVETRQARSVKLLANPQLYD